jgi:glycosyltransferase involved in cell wall biosynthesis
MAFGKKVATDQIKTNRLNIAITADPFIPVPPTLYGGIERIIDLLIIEFQRLGHEVTLFAHKDSNVKCKLIPYKTDIGGLKNDLLNAWVINKYLLSHKIDVIHSFSRLAYLIPQMPRNIPKLMSYQREPTLSQIKKAVKLSQKGTIAFTGCSDYISNKIKPYASSHTIYNGIDTSLYQFTPLVEDDAPLVFLGRVEHIKGAHTAIEIALQTNKRLIIAGNIPLEAQEYFDSQIKPFLNDNIIYLGPVNDKQKNELLGSAAALLMPIHWNEPFGIVMIEATACGTPVIGFNKGAVPEVIKNNVNGYVVGNIDEAIVKVKQISKIDRKLVREDTVQRFSFDKITIEYLSVYKNLVNER